MNGATKRLSARARANRRNAQKSTGPRTPAGKARVARNAMIHGLCASAGGAPTADVSGLASLIAGDGADPTRLALAREVALADEAVRRARRARHALLTLQAEPEPTIEGLILMVRELSHMFGLLDRLAQYQHLAKRVHKGRPLKIDNYPRFRGLFQKLAEAPLRLTAFDQRAVEECARLTLAQARLLDRYEADALRRRQRAIAAFDRLLSSNFCD